MEWLEDADVEDIVDAGALRQVETVRDGAHAFDDLERPSVPRCKLAFGVGHEGLSGTVEETQPDPIPHGEHDVAVMSVVVPLGVSLRLEKTVADVGEERVPVLQQLVHRRGPGRGRLVRHQGG
jgi:hypothetical protein